MIAEIDKALGEGWEVPCFIAIERMESCDFAKGQWIGSDERQISTLALYDQLLIVAQQLPMAISTALPEPLTCVQVNAGQDAAAKSIERIVIDHGV